MNALIELLGNFHPLFLHLPIGILMYAYLHLGFDLWIKKKEQPVNINFALGIGSLSAILSATTGYFLSLNGEYEGSLLDWHKWLGIGVAVGSVILYFLYDNEDLKKNFFGIFTGFMILLTITGHYGGSITHGEGFLSLESEQEGKSKFYEDINKAHIFNDLVMPLAKRKCISCHNPKKKKGKLLLNSLDGWKSGGASGSFIIMGNASASLLTSRIHLSLEDDDHMPPSGKLQLEEDEIQLLDWWIKSMTTYDHLVSDLSPPDHIMKYIDKKLNASNHNVPIIDDSDKNYAI